MAPRVLVACEMSGRVRTAFARRGWDAVSCDLLPDESAQWCPDMDPAFPGKHYQGDVRDILDDAWDLVIAHPPCTDLSQAGANRWKQKQADGRQQAAIDFFMLFVTEAPTWAYMAIENPVGIMNSRYRHPDQIVEPWWFGDPFAKKTCLWYPETEFCARLPDLQPQSAVSPTGRVCTGGGSWRTDRLQGKTGMSSWEDSQGRKRRHILRSLTMPGFAQAMADQWGPFIEACS